MRKYGKKAVTPVKIANQAWAYTQQRIEPLHLGSLRSPFFIHRQDRGGQFISYRKLEQWKNAIASQLQKCVTVQQLNFLKSAISKDSKKYGKQYNDTVQLFLHQIWQKCQEKLLRKREAIAIATVY